MRTKRKLNLNIDLWIVLLLAFVVLTASCQKTETFTGPKEKVTIGIGSGGLPIPFIIAREKGFFRDVGVDATVRIYPSAIKSNDAMFAGEIDISCIGDIQIVMQSFMRDDFSVIATYASSNDNIKVIGRKDRGVDKPEDLKGKIIGTPDAVGTHFFLNVYLTEHGIDPSAIKIVTLSPMELPEALGEGKVDAIVIYEPYASMAMKSLPDQAIKLPRSNLYKQTFNLAVMRSYTKAHADVLKKILKAVDRAILFIEQNGDESIAIVNNSLKPGEDLLVSSQDDLVFELSLEHSLFTILEDEARWAIATKFTEKTKVPNYLGYFYLDALKAVKPKDVSIVI
jgi:NitT/TauT family transport system substrate-binding protein